MTTGGAMPARRRTTNLSKAVARALRHDPSSYGLDLDHHGWVPVDELVAALNRQRQWRDVDRAELVAMVQDQAKRRYEIRGDRIRALYGHSVAIDPSSDAAAPPDVLFHGTPRGALASIIADGLRPMSRQYVHLSVDEDQARAVGRRRSRDVVILRVAARDAAAAGIRFWRASDSVWLCRGVPPEFLDTQRSAAR